MLYFHPRGIGPRTRKDIPMTENINLDDLDLIEDEALDATAARAIICMYPCVACRQ